jgi:hypothetical protein
MAKLESRMEPAGAERNRPSLSVSEWARANQWSRREPSDIDLAQVVTEWGASESRLWLLGLPRSQVALGNARWLRKLRFRQMGGGRRSRRETKLRRRLRSQVQLGNENARWLRKLRFRQVGAGNVRAAKLSFEDSCSQAQLGNEIANALCSLALLLSTSYFLLLLFYRPFPNRTVCTVFSTIMASSFSE